MIFATVQTSFISWKFHREFATVHHIFRHLNHKWAMIRVYPSIYIISFLFQDINERIVAVIDNDIKYFQISKLMMNPKSIHPSNWSWLNRKSQISSQDIKAAGYYKSGESFGLHVFGDMSLFIQKQIWILDAWFKRHKETWKKYKNKMKLIQYNVFIQIGQNAVHFWLHSINYRKVS